MQGVRSAFAPTCILVGKEKVTGGWDVCEGHEGPQGCGIDKFAGRGAFSRIGLMTQITSGSSSRGGKKNGAPHHT